jgi:hypothetical protein
MRELNTLNKSELIKLVNDLCEVSQENSDHVNSYLESEGVSPNFELLLKQREKSIKKALFDSDYDEYFPEYDFEKVDRLLKSWDKVCKEEFFPLAQLYVYTVEQAHSITMEFGDIDEDYYHSVGEWYERACELVRDLKSCKERDELINRLKAIRDSGEVIGWGYGDDLCDSFSMLESAYLLGVDV